MNSAIRHMMLHQDTLADEYDAILGYRTSHAGIVLPAASTPYPGHNMVTFDGANDYMSLASNPFPATAEYFTAAWCINPTNFSVARQLLFANAGARVTIAATTGIPQLNFISINGVSLTSGTVPLVAGQKNIVQVNARCGPTMADTYYGIIVNGVLSEEADGVGGTNGLTFSTYSAWRMFANLTPGAWFLGGVGFAWLTAGDTAAHFITDPSKFYSASGDVDLGADFSSPGIRPIVGYGGRQVAADWNAGTNLGSGSNWTMAGGV